MNTTNIYTQEGELQYTPYIYQITIKKNGDFKHYIGSKTHQTSSRYIDGRHYKCANPELFLNGLYNGQGRVNEYLEDGWVVSERKVVETFSGDAKGRAACGQKESEILQDLDVCNNDLYLNERLWGAPAMSEETRKRISEAIKGKRLGKTLSEEVKRMMSVRRGWSQDQINHLVELREKSGLSWVKLSKVFGCDHMTVRSLYRKHARMSQVEWLKEQISRAKKEKKV